MQDQSIIRQHDNRMLAALPDGVLARLEPSFTEILGSIGDVLLEAGVPIERIYFPGSGMISLLVVSEAGDTIEAATIGREGAAGLQGGLGARNSFTRAIVQIPGRFSVLPAKIFRDVVTEHDELRDLIAGYTELLWAEAQQTVACNAIHDASSRLCRWLLQCSDRIESLHLQLTQDFMAQMLGVRRTTVTLLAQELQRSGTIKYSRGRLTILDRPALQRGACECYRVVQKNTLPQRLGIPFPANRDAHPNTDAPG